MARISLSACLLLIVPVFCPAQQADTLPYAPEYTGEIRRGPDGRLRADKPAVRAGETARPATLVVGPNERIATITEAAKLARDGDVVEIRPGDYRGQPAIWTQKDLTIRGGTPRPAMIADGKNAEGKALWVIRGGTVRVENIEFRGARVPHGNGAGIRFERGQLAVHRCAFIDNEMGILTGNSPESSLDVSDSEFGTAARNELDLHHLLYVGAISRFVLSGSRFENGYLGHLVKSRARENHVRYNLLVDGEKGRSSYELEFPNGGIAYVIGNVIGQGAGTDNPILVSYGGEGPRWPDNALFFVHNTLINDLHRGTFLRIWNEKFPASVESWVINNVTIGNGDLFPPALGRFEGNRSAERRDLIEIGGLPLRLKGDSPLRGAVRIPGEARGVNLLPAAEFTFPVGSRPIRPASALAPGAFQ